LSNLKICHFPGEAIVVEQNILPCLTLEFYKEFFHNIPDMLLVADPYSGEIINCNKAFLQKLGYTPQEIAQLNLFEDIHHCDCSAELNACRQEVIERGFVENWELALKTKNGDRIITTINISTIRNAENKVTLACAIYRDMTEIIENRQKLEKTNEEIYKRNEELNTLLHLISHDLKSPLRGIQLISQWLIEDEYKNLSATSQRYLESLQQRVNRAETLLEDITQYFFQPTKEHILENVNSTFIEEEFNNRIYIPVGFQVIVKGVPKQFYTKKTPLMIILCNLIDNAIKHHHKVYKGKVTITMTEEQQFYRFTVSDNGPGIAPSYHDYIFGFFNKLQPRDKVEGSGLGLAIVKSLIQGEGGEIKLISQEGQGATFIFTWPKWEANVQQ
jgi:PAS domain S-box-containing protein